MFSVNWIKKGAISMSRKVTQLFTMLILLSFVLSGFAPISANSQSQLGSSQISNLGTWEIFTSPTEEDLSGISMLSSNDGWAVGNNGTILHWNGNIWSKVVSPTSFDLFSVDMLSATNGWAVGADGVILHWNGANWTQVQSPVGFWLMDVQMLTSSDGWIVGMGGTLLHWDGNNWTQAPADYVPHIEAVDMLSSTQGWSVGGDITIEILRWNGSNWSNVAAPSIGSRLLSVDMISSTDGWSGGRDGMMVRWDGSNWSKVGIPTDAWIEDIEMVSSSDGWAVGQYGEILHWDGSSWSLVQSPLPFGWLFDIDMLSAYEGWSVGLSGVILHYVPSLEINYTTGAPGSFFTIIGDNYPPDSTIKISVNNQLLGTVQSDPSGALEFLFETSQADEGTYIVDAAVNPGASVRFKLNSNDPLRPQEGSGPIIEIPAGIAIDFIYLPLIIE
jgi:photosystem II stability/assembly factor-like uncharacterized protein